MSPRHLFMECGIINWVHGRNFGILGLYYVFFPTEETNMSAVTLYAAIGIPVLIIALIARVFINKWGRKKTAEKQNKQ